jgi:hypothetical protein
MYAKALMKAIEMLQSDGQLSESTAEQAFDGFISEASAEMAKESVVVMEKSTAKAQRAGWLESNKDMLVPQPEDEEE